MCDDCFDPAELSRLLDEQEQDDAELEEVVEVEPYLPPSTEVEEALPQIECQRPVWVSASSIAQTTDSTRPGDEPDALFRDALAQMSRVFFQRDRPLAVIVPWDASATPQLLDAAATWGGGDRPLVWVVVTKNDRDDAVEAVSACEWSRGALIEIAAFGDPRAAQREVISLLPIRGVIFIGGNAAELEDARAIPPHVPQFAIGSSGGAAKQLFAQGQAPGQYANPYFGGQQLPPHAFQHAGSYLTLFSEIYRALP